MFRFVSASGFNLGQLIDGVLADRWSAPWSRGALGDWDSFADHLSYFGYLLPILTVAFISMSKVISARSILSVLLTLIMASFLVQSGGRRIIGVIFGSAILYWVLHQKRLTVRTAATVMIAVVLVLGLMELTLRYRNSGWQALWNAEVSEGVEIDQPAGFKIHVDDNFLRLSQIIDLVPAQYPYVYHEQILYTLVRPIPRVLWPGKPTEAGFDLSTALDAKGTSLSSSVVGELYLTGGVLVVFLGGIFYGKIARMFSTLLEHKTASSDLVYSLGSMALFVGIRSMLDLVLMSYTLLAWIAVSRLLISVPMLMSWGRRLSIHLDAVKRPR
jgi:hypothetical protein